MPAIRARKHLSIICSVILLIFAALSQASELVYSQILPKAKQSLLLDVELAGERLVAVGERGHILFSDDQGENWQQAKVPTRQMVTAVYFASPKLGWAVAHDGLILNTRDGGENWELQYDGLAVQKALNMERERNLKHQVKDLEERLVGASAEIALALRDELDEAKDELASAQEKLTELATTAPLLDVFFADEKHGWVSGAFGKLLATENGGKTWTDVSAEVGNEDELHLNAITGQGNAIFMVGEYGLVIRSLDLGKTWEKLPIDYDGTFFTAKLSRDKKLLVIAGLRGNAFISNDLGEHFSVSNTNTDLSFSGASLGLQDDKQVMLVGSGGAVAISHDGGQNFTLSVQKNRLGLSGAQQTPKGNFILVGLGGVAHFEEHSE